MRSRLLAGLALGGLLGLCSGGCTTVAQVTNLSEDSCRSRFVQQLSSILVAEGEKADVAETLASRNVELISKFNMGPRSFFVSSPSGTDYTFFVQLKKKGCLLRLLAKQKGFWSYSNNLTYIATRPLDGCSCAE